MHDKPKKLAPRFKAELRWGRIFLNWLNFSSFYETQLFLWTTLSVCISFRQPIRRWCLFTLLAKDNILLYLASGSSHTFSNSCIKCRFVTFGFFRKKYSYLNKHLKRTFDEFLIFNCPSVSVYRLSLCFLAIIKESSVLVELFGTINNLNWSWKIISFDALCKVNFPLTFISSKFFKVPK